jgi:peptidoglycan/xylan/chitin deacetylase (PgdA/CDA1 family)
MSSVPGDSLPPSTVLRWTPTLLVHEVVPDSTSELPMYAIRQSTLRTVLKDFLSRGYKPGTLEDALGEGKGGGKRFVLTFDDGTRDFLDNALPVLNELGLKATLFIVSGLMGGKRTWKTLSGGEELPPVPLMTPDEVKELHRQGFTIGSHTVSHAVLTSLSEADARRELNESRQTLHDLTGDPIEWFAYPYVALNDSIRGLVKDAGYRGACGAYTAPHSRYYLNRIEVSVFTLPELRKRTNPLFHATRHLARKARGRG